LFEVADNEIRNKKVMCGFANVQMCEFLKQFTLQNSHNSAIRHLSRAETQSRKGELFFAALRLRASFLICTLANPHITFSFLIL